MNIKMICSDLDGTLIPYGEDGVSEELFDLIRELAQRGVVFCPASGRQVTSLRKMFAPVDEHCVYLCQNGASLFKGGRLLDATAMPRPLVEKIAADMWHNSDGRGEVMLATPEMCYLLERGRGMKKRIEFIGNQFKVIQHLSEIPAEEAIVKVSLYVYEGIEPFVPRFVPKYQQMNAAVAGPQWIDTSAANKGTGVKKLCSLLGLHPAEVAAFGDNYNDEAMLDMVGRPYIMENAAAPLCQKYKNHTLRPEATIRQLLADMG